MQSEASKLDFVAPIDLVLAGNIVLNCRFARSAFFLLVVVLSGIERPVEAQVSKGNQILINRGFQVQGMVSNFDPFHLTTYSNANYNSINWILDSTPSAMGTAPGFPWARWVRTNSPSEMPPLGSESSYLSQLVALQLGTNGN